MQNLRLHNVRGPNLDLLAYSRWKIVLPIIWCCPTKFHASATQKYHTVKFSSNQSAVRLDICCICIYTSMHKTCDFISQYGSFATRRILYLTYLLCHDLCCPYILPGSWRCPKTIISWPVIPAQHPNWKPNIARNCYWLWQFQHWFAMHTPLQQRIDRNSSATRASTIAPTYCATMTNDYWHARITLRLG